MLHEWHEIFRPKNRCQLRRKLELTKGKKWCARGDSNSRPSGSKKGKRVRVDNLCRLRIGYTQSCTLSIHSGHLSGNPLSGGFSSILSRGSKWLLEDLSTSVAIRRFAACSSRNIGVPESC